MYENGLFVNTITNNETNKDHIQRPQETPINVNKLLSVQEVD